MHRYVKLMMGPFSVLQGYPLVGFGSTPLPPRSWTNCHIIIKVDLVVLQIQAKYCP
jgi:hypothetical protein